MAKTSHAKIQGTAEDARPSRVGGWRGSPASLEALARHRNTWTDNAKCSRCGRVAVSGRTTCYQHGAARTVTPERQARRDLTRRWPTADVSRELHQLEVYQRTRFGPARFAPVALELCEAWHVRREDPARWVAAVRQARQVIG